MTARAILGAASAAGLALLVAGCSGDPVLVDGDDLPGVTAVTHDEGGGLAPGWTWCEGIAPQLYTSGSTTSTWLSFGERGDAGAVIIDRAEDGLSADGLMSRIEEQADLCAGSESTGLGYSIEPLTGLDEGQQGWRTETKDGERGEYVVAPLDDTRLLAVGVESSGDEMPVELAELVRRAQEGAERF